MAGRGRQGRPGGQKGGDREAERRQIRRWRILAEEAKDGKKVVFKKGHFLTADDAEVLEETNLI